MQYYQDEDFEKAYYLFDSYAKIGNSRAQYNIAIMHYKGQYLEQSNHKAYAWFRLSGETEDNESFLSIAEKIYQSLGDNDKQEAKDEYVKINNIYGGKALDLFMDPKIDYETKPRIDYKVIKVKRPTYPTKMLRKRKIGTVRTEYTIDKNGSVRDVMAVMSDDKAFSKAVFKSLKHYRYAPPSIDGKNKPIYRHCLSNRFLMHDTEADSEKVKKRLQELEEKALSGDRISQYLYANEIEILGQYGWLPDGFEAHSKIDHWYHAAAQQGILEAQYKVGVSLYYRATDNHHREAGWRWLLRSALEGLPESQYLLAMEMLRNPKKLRFIDEPITWLRDASAQEYGIASAKLAWLYATADLDEVYDPKQALNILKESPMTNYYDDAFLWEAEAAAEAGLGNYRRAVKLQKKAIDEAEDWGRSLKEMQLRLQAYQNKKPWRQSVHQL